GRGGGWGLVAPDNGLLSYALAAPPLSGHPWRAVALENPAYQLPNPSHTFHGRDLFAPATAHLAAGVPLEALGAPLESLASLLPDPATPRLYTASQGAVESEIVYVDHFGNLVTGIGPFARTGEALHLSDLAGAPTGIQLAADAAQLALGEVTLRGIRATYGQTQPGDLLMLIGSSGYLEAAVNQGSAAAKLALRAGAPVRLTWKA
ncbi:MAG: SAM-dependent chlorinase/fluorinase, partial [Anaerolineae bacterium]|nr:SAM-dependent chlorinase/fluorinase [Anaerolineae bacterium]